MCGIFAAVDLEQPLQPNETKYFQNLTNISAYRGPDSNGSSIFNLFENNSSGEGFNVFLGHNRLSIIDISENGRQPFIEGDLCIIYNGEIFNYIELRNELIKRGETFRTNTDTEVILKLYKVEGEDSFNQLNGMWAFIILDQSKKRMVVSRDRFSIKPLFLYQKDSSYYFASEIKQILPLIPEKKVNKESMFLFLQQGLTDFNDDTFFCGIKRISPGCNLILDFISKKVELKRYWNFEFDASGSIEDYLSYFRDLFIDSVNIRLRSDVEVGSLLSGGLDSSAVSLVAHDLTGGKIKTFSVVSQDDKSNEGKYVDILVKEKGLHNSKLIIDHKRILNNLDAVLYHQDEPFSTLSIVAQYSILELIKKESGIKVVLGGQGGDEILMGYLKYYFFHLKELWRKKQYYSLLSEIIFSLIYRNTLFNSNLLLAKRYLPFLNKSKNKYLKLNGKLENTWKVSSLAERQIADIEKFSIPALTRYEDRNSMAHSLETRLPFLDHRLVNFSVGLKTEFKIRHGWTKYLLRKSQNELPDTIRWRRDKKGFTIPEDTWFKTIFRDQIINLFKDSLLDELGIIDKKIFKEYYENYLKGVGRIHYSDISKVYIAERWARNQFNKKN